jgi:phosphoglycerate dehydrogenase-like enzyme
MWAGAGELVARAGMSADELARVAFTSAAGVHAVPLAEFAMLGILAFRRGLPGLLADARERRWRAHEPVAELEGATLLVIGAGSIGRRVAALATAFGMRVVGVRRRAGEAVAGFDEMHGAEALGALLPGAHAVVVTLPMTRGTAGMLGREQVAAMRRGAIFVNVGRGGVVDEPALVEALRSGRLAGAALDVFAQEPLPSESPLWDLPNVILSPHTAAMSARENERIVDLFCDNLARYLDGRPLRSRIDVEHFY